MLGHVELSTIEIYTQLSIKKLKEVHNPYPSCESQTQQENAEELAEPPTEEDLFITLAAEILEDPE